jgi:hypothetical protein
MSVHLRRSGKGKESLKKHTISLITKAECYYIMDTQQGIRVIWLKMAQQQRCNSTSLTYTDVSETYALDSV